MLGQDSPPRLGSRTSPSRPRPSSPYPEAGHVATKLGSAPGDHRIGVGLLVPLSLAAQEADREGVIRPDDRVDGLSHAHREALPALDSFSRAGLSACKLVLRFLNLSGCIHAVRRLGHPGDTTRCNIVTCPAAFAIIPVDAGLFPASPPRRWLLDGRATEGLANSYQPHLVTDAHRGGLACAETWSLMQKA